VDKLAAALYRTNHSIERGCEEAGILSKLFDDNMLEDLYQCTHCNVWWHDYELTPDDDDNEICKFCVNYYGK
jgi:hypothetical protein